MGLSEPAVAAEEGLRLRDIARRHVRHFLADFDALEELHPGSYPRLIASGDGAWLVDVDGRRLLDAGNHLGAGQVGHGRREIAERMMAQLERLEFAALDSGVSHVKVAELAERLVEIVPVDDPIFSFTSSGSESNELAFKIARAYHERRGDAERMVVLSRDGSYHGSTLAGMAATGADLFRTGYGPLPPSFEQFSQPSPGRCGFCERGAACTLACADALERSIAAIGAERVAAVIAEPVAILQAVKVPDDRYWERVSRICQDNGILLILDEVVTGFARTGRMFGADHWGVRPDIMTMAKGLTSGYAPMGAVAVARHVEAAFADAPLVHLNTYAGHPVACEAALATLDILEREGLAAHAAELEPVLREGLEEIATVSDRVLKVTALGLLSSIELDVADRTDAAEIVMSLRHAMYERGLIARCSAGGGVLTVVVYPTLVVTREDVMTATRLLSLAIVDVFAMSAR
jgi:adenosylmethionine-8-amino-7-oxononanoate aminotransferase